MALSSMARAPAGFPTAGPQPPPHSAPVVNKQQGPGITGALLDS